MIRKYPIIYMYITFINRNIPFLSHYAYIYICIYIYIFFFNAMYCKSFKYPLLSISTISTQFKWDISVYIRYYQYQQYQHNSNGIFLFIKI